MGAKLFHTDRHDEGNISSSQFCKSAYQKGDDEPKTLHPTDWTQTLCVLNKLQAKYSDLLTLHPTDWTQIQITEHH